MPQVCKRWKQLSKTHADTQRHLALVVSEGTQRDWLQGWPKVRAPALTSISVQALCRQLQEDKVRLPPDVRLVVALAYPHDRLTTACTALVAGRRSACTT